MERIVKFDTSLVTENNGDAIIMSYCDEILHRLFPDAFFVSLPTHEHIFIPSYKFIKKSDYQFVCGTNLLTSQMNQYAQWKIGLHDSVFLKSAVLMGVGWWEYQKKPNLYTRTLLKRVLNNDVCHSVRDSYTEKMLRSIGIDNVINTGCPTMWKLTPEFCKAIPKRKASAVVATVTNYRPNIIRDKQIFDILLQTYATVYVWIQAFEDIAYLKDLGIWGKIKVVSPQLSEYDKLLSEKEVDYCGTRLHAGVRALNYGKRSLIVAVDNRAIEIHNDTNLPIVREEKIKETLEEKINSEWRTEINLPQKNIEFWMQQFKGENI